MRYETTHYTHNMFTVRQYFLKSYNVSDQVGRAVGGHDKILSDCTKINSQRF